MVVYRDKHADVRLEAALAKLWGSERAWQIVDDTMQIRGGRGYETADSLRARGERPDPVERLFRDCRINTIFEGSSEIMRLFIAREALDPHLKLGAAAVNSTLPWRTRARAAIKAGLFYTRWYPRLWLPGGAEPAADSLHPALRADVLEIRRQSRRLARTLFHAMIARGPALERCQMLLGRLVDIGAELFVWSATLARAESLVTDASFNSEEVERLLRKVRYFGKLTRQRLRQHYSELGSGLEKDAVRLSRELVSPA